MASRTPAPLHLIRFRKKLMASPLVAVALLACGTFQPASAQTTPPTKDICYLDSAPMVAGGSAKPDEVTCPTEHLLDFTNMAGAFVTNGIIDGKPVCAYPPDPAAVGLTIDHPDTCYKATRLRVTPTAPKDTFVPGYDVLSNHIFNIPGDYSYSGAGGDARPYRYSIYPQMYGIHLRALRAGEKTTTPIDAWGKCRYVDNHDSSDVFVPFGSSEEWDKFIAAVENKTTSPGLSIETCSLPCVGACKKHGILYGPTTVTSHYLPTELPYARTGTRFPEQGTYTHTFPQTQSCTYIKNDGPPACCNPTEEEGPPDADGNPTTVTVCHPSLDATCKEHTYGWRETYYFSALAGVAKDAPPGVVRENGWSAVTGLDHNDPSCGSDYRGCWLDRCVTDTEPCNSCPPPPSPPPPPPPPPTDGGGGNGRGGGDGSGGPTPPPPRPPPPPPPPPPPRPPPPPPPPPPDPCSNSGF